MADQDDEKSPYDWEASYFRDRAKDRAEHSLAVAPPENAHHSSGPHLHFEAHDPVNHPGHYGGDTVYETIKVVRAWGLGFNLGNSVKYISRAGKKNPATEVEDLKKAIFYLEDEVAYLTGEKKLAD